MCGAIAQRIVDKMVRDTERVDEAPPSSEQRTVRQRGSNMTWFVSRGVLSLFIDEGGELEYRAEVVKHECRTIDPIPYGGKPVPTARLNAAAADLAIFSHGTGWRGALGLFSKELHGPILDDQSTAKVVAPYGDPNEN